MFVPLSMMGMKARAMDRLARSAALLCDGRDTASAGGTGFVCRTLVYHDFRTRLSDSRDKGCSKRNSTRRSIATESLGSKESKGEEGAVYC